MLTWRWLAEHWQAVCGAVAAIAGAAVGVLTYIRKTSAETKIKSLARAITVYADQMKLATGNPELLFSYEELQDTLGKDAAMLRETLTVMESDGRARRSQFAGYWVIN